MLFYRRTGPKSVLLAALFAKTMYVLSCVDGEDFHSKRFLTSLYFVCIFSTSVYFSSIRHHENLQVKTKLASKTAVAAVASDEIKNKSCSEEGGEGVANYVTLLHSFFPM